MSSWNAPARAKAITVAVTVQHQRLLGDAGTIVQEALPREADRLCSTTH